MKLKSGMGAIAVVMVVVLGVAFGLQPRTARAKDNQLEANKKLVLDFDRLVFQAQNPEAARNFLAEDYKQHNPQVPNGRDGFVTFFKRIWPEPKPVEATLAHPPVFIIAEGDLVTEVRSVSRPDPEDKSKTYESFSFDAYRIKDGKFIEHWDGALKGQR